MRRRFLARDRALAAGRSPSKDARGSFSRGVGLNALSWGVIAMIGLVMVYWLARLVMPDLSPRIERNEFGAALFLGAASLAAGMLNATAMSY